MGSTIAALTSVFPALALLIGFVLILTGARDGVLEFVQGGWGFVTVGVIVEFVLPISRRLR